MSVVNPSELFSADKDKAHADFRKLGKIWHPDVSSDSKAGEVFAHIVSLYSRIDTKPIIGKRNKSVEYGNDLTFEYEYEMAFEMGKLYISKRSILYSFEKEGPAERTIQAIKDVSNYIRASPKLSTNPANKIAIAEKYDTYIIYKDVFEEASIFRLSDVCGVGMELDVRHVAWIISRLMNFACLVYAAGYSHNGIVMDNCWIEPTNHRLIILGGWYYAKRIGAKLTEVSSEVYNIMPISIKTSKIVGCGTDIEGVKEVGRKLTFGCSIPEPFKRWLWTTNKNTPYEEFGEWDRVLVESFGARKFVELKIDESKIFG